jgi:hypothetical protein
LIVPGWEIDRVDNETFARPIVLKTGRRYRIRLRLRLTARSAIEPAWTGVAWFSDRPADMPADFLGDFRDPGFLRWENITIKLDEDI